MDIISQKTEEGAHMTVSGVGNNGYTKPMYMAGYYKKQGNQNNSTHTYQMGNSEDFVKISDEAKQKCYAGRAEEHYSARTYEQLNSDPISAIKTQQTFYKPRHWSELKAENWFHDVSIKGFEATMSAFDEETYQADTSLFKVREPNSFTLPDNIVSNSIASFELVDMDSIDFTLNDTSNMPLLVPAKDHLEELQSLVEDEMRKFLKGNDIPGGPSRITYDRNGQISLPENYEYADDFASALAENPKMEHYLKTLAGVNGFYGLTNEIEQNLRSEANDKLQNLIQEYEIPESLSFYSMGFNKEGKMDVSFDYPFKSQLQEALDSEPELTKFLKMASGGEGYVKYIRENREKSLSENSLISINFGSNGKISTTVENSKIS